MYLARVCSTHHPVVLPAKVLERAQPACFMTIHPHLSPTTRSPHAVPTPHPTPSPAESSPMDVLVTNCSAHDGSLTRSQQLIDDDGCTIDPAIMSPVVEHGQHGAGACDIM